VHKQKATSIVLQINNTVQKKSEQLHIRKVAVSC